MSDSGDAPLADAAGFAAASGEQIQEKAQHLVSQAQHKATGELAARKGQAASTLGILADALHNASGEARDREETAVAGYFDSAAAQVDSLASMLRDQDVSQIVRSVQDFGRREPGLFFAGAFALGFAAARFLKSAPGSPPRASRSGGAWDRAAMGDDRFASGRSGWDSASSGQQRAGYGSEAGFASDESRRGTGLAGSADTVIGSDWSATRGDMEPEGR